MFGPPRHSVFSFKVIRSAAIDPITLPPKLPFPMGSELFSHALSVAGEYQEARPSKLLGVSNQMLNPLVYVLCACKEAANKLPKMHS